VNELYADSTTIQMDANCFAKCEFVTLSKKIGDIVGQERVKQERK